MIHRPNSEENGRIFRSPSMGKFFPEQNEREGGINTKMIPYAGR